MNFIFILKLCVTRDTGLVAVTCAFIFTNLFLLCISIAELVYGYFEVILNRHDSSWLACLQYISTVLTVGLE
jgi:hypothetical protein